MGPGERRRGEKFDGKIPVQVTPPTLPWRGAWLTVGGAKVDLIYRDLAAGALSFADVYAGRQHRVACLANLRQAVLATAQGRLAAAGEWVLSENG